MTDIKFRAWNKGISYIFSKPYLLAEYTVLSFAPEDEKLNGIDRLGYDDFEFDCIEQFTGLKDKNGKDIYEGDIVKVSYKEWRKDWEGKDKWNYWDNIENIVFIYGGFMFHTVVFDTDMYRPMMPMFNNCELNGIEVIGSIHESKGDRDSIVLLGTDFTLNHLTEEEATEVLRQAYRTIAKEKENKK